MAGSISERPTRRTTLRLVSALLTLCLLAPSAAAWSGKGQKNFKQGLKHEAAQQWEKAAEEFSLAAAADPGNSEYQLHLRRALFNASQQFSQQGAALMERADYLGAYNAFRRAYGYDPANELARKLMERAFKLQTGEGDKRDAARPSPAARPRDEARVLPTSFDATVGDLPAPSRGDGRAPRDEALPAPRNEQLQTIQYSGDLEKFIKYLARQIRVNVVFDRDFPKREVSVDLLDVTAAQALDYIFLTQGLFFQKLSSRTIVVADQVKRPQYQQLVLRTFYLYNVDPADARTLITASIPPQAGRQPVITANKATNSITVRDTPENVRLVGELLRSIDKERAEVVMDVNIFEVSREDLMQFGNQIGTGDTLANLGGIQKGLSVLGGSREVVTQALSSIPTALGAAFLVPPTALSALQRRGNTRLVASTQVHAFDGEKSTAHIGQRVPVQTAAVAPYGSVSTGGDGNNAQQGATQGLFGGNGYPVIQYEKTGLTLEFTPQVFPNLDVQVKMSIKSNDVTRTAGAAALTPTFTERNIEGTARMQNNRTLMIASVAQNQQSRGRQGLPILGLVPVLGNLFSAPRREDTQTDIVIAVTPHVMRASTVTPQDEEMHPSGTLQTPTAGTLEAMLNEVVREEQLAAARSLPTHATVEVPTRAGVAAGVAARQPDARIEPANSPNDPAVVSTAETQAAETQANGVTFVPAPKELMNGVVNRPDSRTDARDAVLTSPAVGRHDDAPAEVAKPEHSKPEPSQPEALKPATRKRVAGNSLFSFGQPSQPAARVRDASLTTEAPAAVSVITEKPLTDRAAASASSAASLRLMSEPRPLRVGERRQLKVLLKTDAPLGLLALTFRLDPRVLAVRSVGSGTLAAPGDARVTHTVTPEGLLLVTVAPGQTSSPLSGAGVLLVFDVEALSAGDAPLRFDADDVHLVATDGRKVLVKVMTDQLSVGE